MLWSNTARLPVPDPAGSAVSSAVSVPEAGCADDPEAEADAGAEAALPAALPAAGRAEDAPVDAPVDARVDGSADADDRAAVT
jgi:hypothetical protein